MWGGLGGRMNGSNADVVRGEVEVGPLSLERAVSVSSCYVTNSPQTIAV